MAKRGFKERFRRCDDCGKPYMQRNYNQLRCADCQKKKQAEALKQKRDLKLKKKDYIAWVEKHDPNICKKVKSCEYGVLCGGIWICDYLSIVGNRRPCSVNGCAVYRSRCRIKGGTK